MPYLPGLFALEGVSGTGLYFTDPERTFLLAYHPTARQGGLTVRSGRAGDGWRLNWMADIQHNERTTAGFARLHLRPDEARRTMDALDQYAEPSAPSPTALHDLTHIDEHAFELLVEAQRREIWDNRDFAEDDIYPGRRGKSGLAFLRTRLGGVAFEAAGQDIGDEGMRVARLSGGLDLGSKDALAAQRLEIDAGGYRRRRYGSESTEQYRDPAVGLGWRLDTRAAFMRLRGERRGSGLVSGEVVSGMRAGAYAFEIAGVFRDRTPALSPLARAILLDDPEETAGQEQRTELETETPRSVILESSGLELAVRAQTESSPATDWRRRLLQPENRTDRSFLMLKSSGENESGARFYPEESAVLRLRLRGPRLHLLLISTVSEGRPRIFGRIQVRLPL